MILIILFFLPKPPVLAVLLHSIPGALVASHHIRNPTSYAFRRARAALLGATSDRFVVIITVQIRRVDV